MQNNSKWLLLTGKLTSSCSILYYFLSSFVHSFYIRTRKLFFSLLNSLLLLLCELSLHTSTTFECRKWENCTFIYSTGVNFAKTGRMSGIYVCNYWCIALLLHDSFTAGNLSINRLPVKCGCYGKLTYNTDILQIDNINKLISSN